MGYFQIQKFVKKMMLKFIKPSVIVNVDGGVLKVDYMNPENQLDGKGSNALIMIC